MNRQEDFSKKRPLTLEDNDFLFKLGVYIPGKEKFDSAVIKYMNSDFIVEEIQPDGTITSIDYTAKTNSLDIPQCNIYHATLVKNNLKTTDAINILAQKFGVPTKNISYYGLKDDDAITSQRISLVGVSKEKILSVDFDNLFLKDIIPSRTTLSPGQNKGNKFSIIIRSEKSFNTEILKSFPPDKPIEFYNFFYTQRFLAPRYSNFFWATFILKGNAELAIKSFLTQTGSTESDFEKEIRESVFSHYRDWKHMYEIFTLNNHEGWFNKELDVLEYLISDPNNFTGALNSINDQVKLWLYSISSWFFNHKITECIKAKKTVPCVLPMFLSQKKEEYSIYQDFAESLGIYPPDTKFLKNNFKIESFGSKVSTKASVTIHKACFLSDKSLNLVFSLPTGSYATTFLAHYFNLYSGDYSELQIEKEIFLNTIIENNFARKEALDFFK